ncbi:MAG TPA: hypothetical protein VKF60_17675 [Myxococcota bacterium]|nr:hypothetical protein [Myxococcota bacterium]
MTRDSVTMTFRRLFLILLSALVLLGLGTYLAGERTEVAVLRSYEADGTPKDTKMWIVDYDGKPYVRIGRPGRGWGERLKANPEVELTRRGGAPSPRVAAVVAEPDTIRAVEHAFREKYGWVDWWFGLVVRSHPDTVRLDPRE